MTELATGLFLVFHGITTTALWVAPVSSDAPFDPSYSWLMGDSRPLALVVAVLAGLAAIAAGIGVLTDASWWPAVALLAGSVGVVLTVVWFDPWLVLGLAVSLVVLVIALRALPTR